AGVGAGLLDYHAPCSWHRRSSSGGCWTRSWPASGRRSCRSSTTSAPATGSGCSSVWRWCSPSSSSSRAADSAVSTGRRWWTLLRAPVLGLAAVVLIAVGAGLVMGHAGVWRTTIDERRGQDFRIFLTSVRHARQGRSLYTPTYVRRRTTGERVTGPPNLNLPHTMLPLVPLAGLPTRTALAVWVGAGLLALL